jgi:tetratricopeptide (TPR) repeat protein
MGEVYRAHDMKLGRDVALKVLPAAFARDSDRLARLEREARLLAALNHTNIAHVYGLEDSDDTHAVIMELVDGETLADRIARGAIPQKDVLPIAWQICKALEAAHEHGIIHRDLKPANIKVRPDGTVKVLDFGLAKVVTRESEDLSNSPTISARATENGLILGTAAYMSPEQAAGMPVDRRADLWSFGVVLMEMLTGRRVFEGDSVAHVLASVLTSEPDWTLLPKSTPASVARLLRRCLQKDPARRLDSATAAAIEIEDVIGHVGGAVETAAGSYFRLKPMSVAVLSTLLLGTLFLLVFRRDILQSESRPIVAVSALAVPPVINQSQDQPELDELGGLAQSVLSRRLSAIPGVTIVGSTIVRPRTTDRQQIVVGYTASMRLRRGVSGIVGSTSLTRTVDSRSIWSAEREGDALELLTWANDGFGPALERYALTKSPTGSSQIGHSVPTADKEAVGVYLRGRVLLDTSDDRKTDEEAIARFQSAIDREGNFAFAHAGLSLALSALATHSGQRTWLDRAKASADRALSLDPFCDQAHLAMAIVFRAHGQTDNASIEAKQAVGLTPDSDDAHRVLGSILIDQSQQDPGLAELRTAIALRPRHWKNYYSLGRALLVVHRYDEAISPLQTVRDQMPGFESAYVNLGFAYMELGNWDLAIGTLERALQLDRNDHYALNNLATAYYWNQQFDKALDLYNQATLLDPENAKTFMNLGEAYDALGRTTDARMAYARAIQLADRRRQTSFDAATEAIAAKCEAKLGHGANAEARALAAWATDEKNADVLFKLAVVYAIGHQTDKALDRLEQAVNLGYSRVRVRDDQDLKTLRAEPRFRRLLPQ